MKMVETFGPTHEIKWRHNAREHSLITLLNLWLSKTEIYFKNKHWL
jgi:hypothetical protein